MNFWDYNIWSTLVQLSVVLLSILLGNVIRRKVKFIKNSLLPASVIGGMIIFILKFIPQVSKFIDSSFMEALTYHCLGLGFIALSLKTNEKRKDDNKLIIMDSGIITVNGYLIQAIIGLTITILLAITVLPNFFPAAGLLLPMGYGQGTGQALNIGKVFEGLGFKNGTSFGLAIAAVGFMVACIVGVVYLNILKKKGKLELQQQRKVDSSLLNSDIYEKDEAPLNESVDKLTMQIAIIISVYVVTFLVISGLSFLSENYLGKFGVNTIKPLLWGFNFLFGSIFAILTKKVFSILRKHKIMTHQHINNYMMNRLSGLFFDVMIVSGIAAIDWQNLTGLLIPLILVCAFGAIGTFFYIKWVCKKIYPNYEYEAFFSIFGMLTGTASTGMILLREIDPNFETPASQNLVLQQLPAIIFGAPLLLMVGFAGQNLTNTLIVFGVIIVMFIVYNIILLRKYIFKKKNK